MTNLSAEHICLFCKHTTNACKCKRDVGRPMVNHLIERFTSYPDIWGTIPDQDFYCMFYERDQTKPGYIK